MFIGHYALGSAGRALLRSRGATALAPVPRGPALGTWFLAVQWLDLVWPLLVLAGIERVRVAPGITAFTPLDFTWYPYTHSLLAALLWGAGFGAVYYLRRRDARAAVWLAGGVFSHWVLDVLAHRADLPLYPASRVALGLGLWHSVVATLVVEGALFAAGVWLYTRAAPARDGTGVWAWWGLVAFLVVTYLGAAFGPPPPSDTAVAVSALGLWLLVPWAYWVDRHRE